ncbi:MAG: permease, partial [Deltaproteobacteria bacterium]|nr:permease [Deltaproteobacteria bacterium]
MSKESAAVAIYNNHTEAETAIRTLEKAGVNM